MDKQPEAQAVAYDKNEVEALLLEAILRVVEFLPDPENSDYLKLCSYCQSYTHLEGCELGKALKESIQAVDAVLAKVQPALVVLQAENVTLKERIKKLEAAIEREFRWRAKVGGVKESNWRTLVVTKELQGILPKESDHA